MKILIVEDEKLLADSLKTLLESKGFDVETVYDGISGAEYAELGVYDLLILDVMMPGMDGYAVARSVRARRCGVPILMLTARSSLEDRVEGLNAGADYYLTKPFDTRELLACINALLRRQGAQVDALSFGNTTLDLASGTLCCAEKSVRLSAREFDVMRLLLQSGGSNLSKEALLSRVWGFDSNAVENSVEVYVGFLRKKLASIGSNVRIESVRRLGYHLDHPYTVWTPKNAPAAVCRHQYGDRARDPLHDLRRAAAHHARESRAGIRGYDHRRSRRPLAAQLAGHGLPSSLFHRPHIALRQRTRERDELL